jgi:hypothetical protein
MPPGSTMIHILFSAGSGLSALTVRAILRARESAATHKENAPSSAFWSAAGMPYFWD